MVFFRMIEKINRNPNLSDEEKDRRGKLVEDCWLNHGKEYFTLFNKLNPHKLNAKTLAVILKLLNVSHILMCVYEGEDYRKKPLNPKKVDEFLVEMGELPPDEKIFGEL